MKNTGIFFIWENDFPSVYSHTSVSFLKHCRGFLEAKHGSIDAAERIVEMCIKPDRVKELKQAFPDATLLPLTTSNKLPEALAKRIGMTIGGSAKVSDGLSRKRMSAIERLLHKPAFTGDIVAGQRYILVDDIITQGGTVAALRKFVLIRGGIVCAITTLAVSATNRHLAPKCEKIAMLHEKFGKRHLLELLHKYAGIDCLGELTNPQISYLMQFKELSGLAKKLEQCACKNAASLDLTVMA